MSRSPAAADLAVPAITILKDYPQLSLLRQTHQVILMHTWIRDVNTGRQDFVFYADRLIRLIVEEGLSLLPVQRKDVITPTGERYEGLEPAAGVCGVSIMRAGEVMETALRDTCRGARIGKILIQRNESTAEPDDRFSYSKLPNDIADRWVFLMDPMLATGGSAIRAVNILKNQYGVKEERIIFLNVVSCPEGLHAFCNKFPKIRVVTSAIDDCLNEKKYIIPGLGDFGDRYFGTTH